MVIRAGGLPMHNVSADGAVVVAVVDSSAESLGDWWSPLGCLSPYYYLSDDLILMIAVKLINPCSLVIVEFFVRMLFLLVISSLLAW